jgi:hypothetical protein
MKCLECGKEYKLLSNHIWQTHDMSVRDYKLKHNLPLSKALADEEWLEKMRNIGHAQKDTKEGRKVLSKLIAAGLENVSLIRSGFKKQETPKRNIWPKCSREKVGIAGGKASRKRALRKYDIVKKEWADGVSVKELSIDAGTAKRWVDDGLLPKRKRKITKSTPDNKNT